VPEILKWDSLEGYVKARSVEDYDKLPKTEQASLKLLEAIDIAKTHAITTLGQSFWNRLSLKRHSEIIAQTTTFIDQARATVKSENEQPEIEQPVAIKAQDLPTQNLSIFNLRWLIFFAFAAAMLIKSFKDILKPFRPKKLDKGGKPEFDIFNPLQGKAQSELIADPLSNVTYFDPDKKTRVKTIGLLTKTLPFGKRKIIATLHYRQMKRTG
jgi:hypothetical protein